MITVLICHSVNCDYSLLQWTGLLWRIVLFISVINQILSTEERDMSTVGNPPHPPHMNSCSVVKQWKHWGVNYITKKNPNAFEPIMWVNRQRRLKSPSFLLQSFVKHEPGMAAAWLERVHLSTRRLELSVKEQAAFLTPQRRRRINESTAWSFYPCGIWSWKYRLFVKFVSLYLPVKVWLISYTGGGEYRFLPLWWERKAWTGGPWNGDILMNILK